MSLLRLGLKSDKRAALVIGGSGNPAALLFAEKRQRVSLLRLGLKNDKRAALAVGGSGNPAALLFNPGLRRA